MKLVRSILTLVVACVLLANLGMAVASDADGDVNKIVVYDELVPTETDTEWLAELYAKGWRRYDVVNKTIPMYLRIMENDAEYLGNCYDITAVIRYNSYWIYLLKDDTVYYKDTSFDEEFIWTKYLHEAYLRGYAYLDEAGNILEINYEAEQDMDRDEIEIPFPPRNAKNLMLYVFGYSWDGIESIGWIDAESLIIEEGNG
ncbi:MAG: hypothetical protein IJ867_09010 [Clostridia bacterium]|nr:hypothetical protein [Clostridia bacterium]